jgi:type IV secretory pathway TrbF-like protein
MPRREIRCDREVLSHAIQDGLNRFVRDVLRPRGLLDEKEFDKLQTQIYQEANSIIQAVADSWQVSWVEDAT